MKTVRLTEDEAVAVRVALRTTQMTHTELISMATGKEMRHMLTNSVKLLSSAERKLENG